MLTLHRAASFTSRAGQLSSNVRQHKYTPMNIVPELAAAVSRYSLGLFRSTPADYNGLLHHFTDANGLIGLTRDHAMHATHAGFVNDQTEVDYGLTLLGSAAAALRKRSLGSDSDAICAHVETLAQMHMSHKFYYIVCFSEKEDHHGQWMLYADAGKGYAVGFKKPDLQLLTDNGQAESPKLLKVVYDETEQQQLISSCLAELIILASNTTFSLSLEDKLSLVNVVWSDIGLFCLAMKDHRFSDEAEWRLCLRRSNAAEDELLFRAGRYGLTPYKRLVCRKNGPQRNYPLPIASIRAGPAIEKTAAGRSLGLLCRNTGHIGVQVHTSTLSTRRAA